MRNEKKNSAEYFNKINCLKLFAFNKVDIKISIKTIQLKLKKKNSFHIKFKRKKPHWPTIYITAYKYVNQRCANTLYTKKR